MAKKIIVRNPKFRNGQEIYHTDDGFIGIYKDRVIDVTDKNVGKVLYEIIDVGYDYDHVLTLEYT